MGMKAAQVRPAACTIEKHPQQAVTELNMIKLSYLIILKK